MLCISLACSPSSSARRRVPFILLDCKSCSTLLQLYIGEAIWAFLFGVVIGKSETSPFNPIPLTFFALLGPYGANIFDPRAWGNHNTANFITLELTRVVLAIGVFAVGVELPKAYMRKHWQSILFLLLPVMTYVRLFPPLSTPFGTYRSPRGGLFPQGSFMPLFQNSISSRPLPLLHVSPQPTPSLLLPWSGVDMPRNTSRPISDISWQPSAVATTGPHSHSYSSLYILLPMIT